MSTIAILWELFQHMEWADACVWKSVFGSPAARSDSTVRTRLYHLHMVHWAFLQVWLDQPLPKIPEQSTFTDIVALASWGQETQWKNAAVHRADGRSSIAKSRQSSLAR